MKKFLQKTLAMLVLCLVSMSAMAETVVFTPSNVPTGKSVTVDDVTLATTSSSGFRHYTSDFDLGSANLPFYISVPEDYKILSISINANYTPALNCDLGVYSDGNWECGSEIVRKVDFVTQIGWTEFYSITVVYDLAVAPVVLNVGESGWTSFCLDKAFTLPAEYTPYIVTGVNGNELVLTEVTPGYASEEINYDFEHNLVSMNGEDMVVEGANPALNAVLHTTVYSGPQTGYFFGADTYAGDYMEFSLPDDYDGSITYVEVKPYPGQGTTWKFNSGSFGTTTHYDVNGKSVRITYGGTGNYYYLLNVKVGVEGVGDKAVIPANAGILVCGPQGEVAYEKSSAAPSDVTGNLLVGCTADATWNEAGKTYYKFSLNAANEEGSAGFYWGVDGGASIEAHAGKAYLVLDGAAPSNRFLINGFDEETTGIEAIATESNDAIFNLQGQRVNATAAGIYVKNGKKFIVK